MTESAADKMQLTPFVAESDHGNTQIVVGLRADEDSAPLIALSIPSQLLEKPVFLGTNLYVFINEKGAIRPDAPDIGVGILEEMDERGQVESTTIDELIESTIRGDAHDPNTGAFGVMRKYKRLQKSLARAVKLVDAEIARRKGSGTDGRVED